MVSLKVYNNNTNRQNIHNNEHRRPHRTATRRIPMSLVHRYSTIYIMCVSSLNEHTHTHTHEPASWNVCHNIFGWIGWIDDSRDDSSFPRVYGIAVNYCLMRPFVVRTHFGPTPFTQMQWTKTMRINSSAATDRSVCSKSMRVQSERKVK